MNRKNMDLVDGQEGQILLLILLGGNFLKNC